MRRDVAKSRHGEQRAGEAEGGGEGGGRSATGAGDEAGARNGGNAREAAESSRGARATTASGDEEGGGDDCVQTPRHNETVNARELRGLSASSGFSHSARWGGGPRRRKERTHSGEERRATPPRERGGVTQVSSAKPTRQTLGKGVRIAAEVVERMDNGDDTWLGERRARLRQRQAESRNRGDG